MMTHNVNITPGANVAIRRSLRAKLPPSLDIQSTDLRLRKVIGQGIIS